MEYRIVVSPFISKLTCIMHLVCNSHCEYKIIKTKDSPFRSSEMRRQNKTSPPSSDLWKGKDYSQTKPHLVRFSIRNIIYGKVVFINFVNFHLSVPLAPTRTTLKF